MKIEFRIEDGQTLLLFPHDENRDKTITVWSEKQEHASAARGYLRTLRKPETPGEQKDAWRTLRKYIERYKHALV
ncbi:hypothetical protein [Comamonas antarctica]|uniref:hypothetical protein n=1 Tax=Comamonas antarctica TaxID=2743470 RepID=UPI0028E2A1B4|nr:hypothetical protein [Comamonas antarctica]